MHGPDIHGLRSLTAETVASGTLLWQAGPERRTRWLAKAMQLLRDENTPLGAALREQLLAVCGLSAPMIEWGLESSLRPFTAEGLLALDARCKAAHPRRPLGEQPADGGGRNMPLQRQPVHHAGMARQQVVGSSQRLSDGVERAHDLVVHRETLGPQMRDPAGAATAGRVAPNCHP